MSESTRIWMEISFNVLYLGAIWGLVIVMSRRLAVLPAPDQSIGSLFLGAFGLLAIGDTGHLGFRLWAYALGDLHATVGLLGVEVGLVGLGALAEKDRTFLWIGLMIVLSYGFYMPVIFFVQQVPAIGMLMIPKTIAYVAIGFLAYFRYFRPNAAASPRGAGRSRGSPLNPGVSP